MVSSFGHMSQTKIKLWSERWETTNHIMSQPCGTHFPFPNQLPTQATTAGQPVVCISPFMTCRRGIKGEPGLLKQHPKPRNAGATQSGAL